jgi:hypothetical protein
VPMGEGSCCIDEHCISRRRVQNMLHQTNFWSFICRVHQTNSWSFICRVQHVLHPSPASANE